MMVTLEIETYDRRLGLDITQPSAEMPEGMSVKELESRGYKAVGIPDTVILAVSIPLNVTASLAANWLYDKLKGRSERIRIDRREITIEKGEIARILEEKMDIER